jgi:hypothetical protein
MTYWDRNSQSIYLSFCDNGTNHMRQYKADNNLSRILVSATAGRAYCNMNIFACRVVTYRIMYAYNTRTNKKIFEKVYAFDCNPR